MGGVFILGSSPGCSSHPAPARKEGFESELSPVLGLGCMSQPTCPDGPGLRMSRRPSLKGQLGVSDLGHTVPTNPVLDGLKCSAFGVLEAEPWMPVWK